MLNLLLRRYIAPGKGILAFMIGYPINKADLEREIKYQESIYRVLKDLPESAKRQLEHLEALKAQLKALEEKG